MRLSAVFREPLLHFLIVGGLLFAVYRRQSDEAAPEQEKTITISVMEIERVVAAWSKAENRAPTDVEVEQLTERRVREEILYREALALGLDRDDPSVREHLATKTEFLIGGGALFEAPTDDALRRFFEERRNDYGGLDFSAVRDRVSRDFAEFRQNREREAAFQRLRAQYRIVVESAPR